MNVTAEKKRNTTLRAACKVAQVRQHPKPTRLTASAIREALAGKGLKTFPNMQSLITHIGL
jgi:hypothetical protein